MYYFFPISRSIKYISSNLRVSISIVICDRSTETVCLRPSLISSFFFCSSARQDQSENPALGRKTNTDELSEMLQHTTLEGGTECAASSLYIGHPQDLSLFASLPFCHLRDFLLMFVFYLFVRSGCNQFSISAGLATFINLFGRSERMLLCYTRHNRFKNIKKFKIKQNARQKSQNTRRKKQNLFCSSPRYDTIRQ